MSSKHLEEPVNKRTLCDPCSRKINEKGHKTGFDLFAIVGSNFLHGVLLRIELGHDLQRSRLVHVRGFGRHAHFLLIDHSERQHGDIILYIHNTSKTVVSVRTIHKTHVKALPNLKQKSTSIRDLWKIVIFAPTNR